MKDKGPTVDLSYGDPRFGSHLQASPHKWVLLLGSPNVTCVTSFSATEVQKQTGYCFYS